MSEVRGNSEGEGEGLELDYISVGGGPCVSWFVHPPQIFACQGCYFEVK